MARMNLSKKEEIAGKDFLKITEEKLHGYETFASNSNERRRRKYVSTILHTAHRISENDAEKVFKTEVEYEVNGKKYYRLCNPRITLKAYMMLIKKKRKRGENEGFDYLYGIVTTGTRKIMQECEKDFKHNCWIIKDKVTEDEPEKNE
ncbi:hypothetical protein Glove_350g142 [Diversispora epigaea]|uniref:Uncharacterized protein n=1 Tax=Diversispora epigaea TaxID=1348612 RepID=A0A397HHB1_9GLOM|nr:hypothetical protein Glove_350g142 [Diversispora epigaea]